jgi:hypothetical protein
MNVEDVRSLSISRLSVNSSIFSGDNGTTLTVDFAALDPSELMEQLSFDEEKKNWAEVLYHTLYDSDALEKYGSYFTGSQPSYSGDSYGGGIEYGGGESSDIDISRFVSPETKNNLDLAAYAIQAWENCWGYVWGTYGNVLTQSLFDYKLEQYPDGVGDYKDFIEEHWLGGRTTDCVGLIKGYGWLDAESEIGYAVNGIGLRRRSNVQIRYSIGTMEDIPKSSASPSGKRDISASTSARLCIEAMWTKYALSKRKWAGRALARLVNNRKSIYRRRGGSFVRNNKIKASAPRHGITLSELADRSRFVSSNQPREALQCRCRDCSSNMTPRWRWISRGGTMR